MTVASVSKCPPEQVKPPTPGRRRTMTAIRGTGNRTTEQRLASLLRRYHVSGWRRHLKLPGRPDFSFPIEMVAIFVDGCFWHGCPRCYKAPKQNAGFWAEKISSNRRRDKRVSRELRLAGWSVIRIWEHDLVCGERAIGRIKRALMAKGRMP
jgi:DNA mismatch endonuclease, patch repair protein